MTTWVVLPSIVFGSVDSHCFASVFPLWNARDLPGDFHLAGDLARFSCGVFLPLELQGIDDGFSSANQVHQIIRPGFARRPD